MSPPLFHVRPSSAMGPLRAGVRHGFASESSGQGRRTGTYSPGQSAYASSGSPVSFAADAPYFAATSLTG